MQFSRSPVEPFNLVKTVILPSQMAIDYSLRIRTISQPKRDKIYPLEKRRRKPLDQQRLPKRRPIPRNITLTGRRRDKNRERMRLKRFLESPFSVS